MVDVFCRIVGRTEEPSEAVFLEEGNDEDAVEMFESGFVFVDLGEGGFGVFLGESSKRKRNEFGRSA